MSWRFLSQRDNVSEERLNGEKHGIGNFFKRIFSKSSVHSSESNIVENEESLLDTNEGLTDKEGAKTNSIDLTDENVVNVETLAANTDDDPVFTIDLTDEDVSNVATPAAKAGDDPEFTVVEGFKEEKATGTSLTTEEILSTPINPREPYTKYTFPGLDLLKKYEDNQDYTTKEELLANKKRIIEVLNSFGVQIREISATVGPTITLYEITPAEGVRISKIRNLEDDIALSLAALGIRIIAPMPGKGTIGIEVPNAHACIVSMESILNSRKFQETKMDLPLALGKTITNEVFMVDLAKIPHLLVAGATGQGKSVGLNAMIASLLFKKHPNELKIVLVDPKKVEFSIYNPIANAFMAQVPDVDEEPIITDVTKVVRAHAEGSLYADGSSL